ncbi:MAG TPA: sigma-70 family RNA polymerase sigma factor [Candidatus Binatia bacterium]|nr:sigma-70 family RNA polymerase sigma factor [Candidatus Binatia bacterium]
MAAGLPDQDDHKLLALIRDGSHHAFGVLVRRHTERFYRLAYRYVQNKETAEDIVQDAFLKLWEDPARWQPDRNTKFTTWFYRIVVNLCLDWQKKKRPLELDEETELADERQSLDEAVIRAQGQKRLEKEIAALPERQRMALNLCFDEGLSNQEAADVMGLSLKALQSLIMRAKTTLKERMKPYL